MGAFSGKMTERKRAVRVRRKGFLRRVCLGVATLWLICGLAGVIPAGRAENGGTEPDVTVSSAPTDTPKPVETQAPTDTPKPTETQAPTDTPAPSGDPESTDTPAPLGDPEITDTPAPSGDPETTDTPAPSGDPETTDTPAPSEDPETTDTPAPSEEPETTDTPAPSEEPEEMFVISGDTVTAYLGKGKHKMISLPEGVRAIASGVFKEDPVLEAVMLPDSLEEIGSLAFAECPNLKEILISSDSELKLIGSKAFLNCKKISRAFAEQVEQVAEDAFEGVPEPTVVPTPVIPTPTPEPTPMPEPTEDPYDDIDWDVPVYFPTGRAQPHGKSRVETTHDYDQVQINAAAEESLQPMHALTLGDETLEISLTGETGAEREFTVALRDWRKAEEKAETQGQDAPKGNVLVLSAILPAGGEKPETICWHMNGSALRKLYRSGIDYLVLQRGDAVTAVPTEGFLAGRVYDELKSRGTGTRRFDYTAELPGETETLRWSVTVAGQTWALGEDPMEEIYLTGVKTGSEDLLKISEGE